MSSSFRQKALELKLIFKEPKNSLLGITSAFIFGYFLFWFTDVESICNNFGEIYGYTLIALQVVIAILFGINLAILIHKISIKQNSRKQTGLSAIGSFFGLLVSGCSACGITLASYIGLGAAMATLPLAGLELKVLAIIILFISIWISLTPIQCKIK